MKMRYYFLLALILINSCSIVEKQIIEECAQISKIIGITKQGVIYYYPENLKDFKVNIENEIDLAAKGEKDWTVFIECGEITKDGKTYWGYMYTWPKIIYISFRPKNYMGILFLPAIMHEFEHVRCFRVNGDPDSNHDDCMRGK